MKIKILSLICTTLFSAGIFLSCEEDDQRPTLAAEFTADVQETVAGSEVTFTDKSTGSPSRWNWYFEGGTPSSSVLNSPTVTYEEPGTYNVKLVIGRSGDSTSVTKDGFITVGYPDVTAAFSTDKNTIVEGEAVTFTDESEGFPTGWLWEFIPAGGTPTSSTDQNPVVTFESAGVYTVKLTVTNPKGSDEVVKTDYLTVIDPNSVVAEFTSDVITTYTGGSVQFTDASQGLATAWSWTFEGGTPSTSSEQNPVVTYGTPGRYKVSLTTSNSEQSSVKEADDYVLVVPGNNLVAFYGFNGNSQDSGPNSVDGTVMGEGVSFDGDGRSAGTQSAVFAGAGVVQVPDNSAFNFATGDFSISCWVKTNVSSRMMIWAESGMNGSGDNQAWLRINDNSTDRRLRFAVEDNTGGTILNVGDAAIPGGVADGTWHHIVCVRTGGNRKVYFDGVQIADNTNAVTKDVSGSQNQPFKIGAQQTATGYSNYFTGSIDDLVVYNKALTPEEVAELFGL